MGDLLKALVGAGPSIMRFLLAAVVATIAAGILYDRLIRGESGPPIRDVAPMLVVVGLIGGAVLDRLLRLALQK
jgi:hypothetical protein